MMTGLHVDSDDFRTQGNNTITNAEEFDNEIGNLQSKVSELMTIWNGEAASTFNTEVEKQITNLREFKSILTILGETIVEGSKRFASTEEENASQAKNLFN